jgi:PleD family two-component response regulator
MSVGLAATRDASGGVNDLIADADAALYQAKRSGRDRVCGSPSLALAS